MLLPASLSSPDQVVTVGWSLGGLLGLEDHSMAEPEGSESYKFDYIINSGCIAYCTSVYSCSMKF